MNNIRVQVIFLKLVLLFYLAMYPELDWLGFF